MNLASKVSRCGTLSARNVLLPNSYTRRRLRKTTIAAAPDETKTRGLWHRSYANYVHAEIYSKLIHVSVNASDDADPSILAEIRKLKLDVSRKQLEPDISNLLLARFESHLLISL